MSTTEEKMKSVKAVWDKAAAGPKKDAAHSGLIRPGIPI
jgi:hypothetical protein